MAILIRPAKQHVNFSYRRNCGFTKTVTYVKKNECWE